jgi:hypothetical protein
VKDNPVLSTALACAKRYPDMAANLWDAHHPGQERHRDPEPGLAAEP